MKPPPQTLAEKLLSRAAGRSVLAGESVVCRVDQAMGTDGSIPMALDYLRQMQPDGAPLPPPAAPQRVVFVLDHYGPGSGERWCLITCAEWQSRFASCTCRCDPRS